MPALLVVFVHGWSVTNTDIYGELPARLIAEAAKTGGPRLDVQHIHLGQYVSFRDEVRIPDISRAFDAALAAVLKDAGANRRFACITHSTGGPVVRDWFDRTYVQAKRASECPMSHLIMLAPANFGSALAQLGKTRLAAIKAWFDGVEPGQGVLDWLELGSPEACALNLRWIEDYPRLKLVEGANPLFHFVLSGDTIDRKLYDFVNPYTGEIGSDGVVRLAAANLNATHIVLEQPAVQAGEALPSARKRLRSLLKVSSRRAAPTAFKIIAGASHSGESKGIMRSVHNDGIAHVTVDAILRCLQIKDATAYAALCGAFT
ncbi:MAG: phospholipase, partial [Dokdonella sp.]